MLELEVFAGQERNELSIIEVVRAILEERGRDYEVYFSDLVNEIQNYLEKSDAEIRETLPYFYSALSINGSFIPLGGSKQRLHPWCAINEIGEEIITLKEDENSASKRKPKRANAFMDGDEDAINYSGDDPEDGDLTPESPDLEYDEENPGGEKSEAESYDSEINGTIPDENLDEKVDTSEEDDEDNDLDEK